ncbi:hypothetical protein SEMRO_235_G094830.1 [Seminavis robusta]|uniref:Uncharacterized protein n=1 Tax=Seminavis robusta TaxID=568900 RepID=A0A9N8DRV1_9STRA|nr:hypothetical protein SEMRO_235_G094830.1 [Seminavis robusta]|eukprot:Sro235_g094830.1 n/a (213) ;mRNA; f:73768-74477
MESSSSDSDDEESFHSARGNDPPAMVVSHSTPFSHASDLSNSTRSGQNRSSENANVGVGGTSLDTLAAAAASTPLRNITNNITNNRNNRRNNSRQSTRAMSTPQAAAAPEKEPEIPAEEFEAQYDSRCRDKNPNDDSDDEGELATELLGDLLEPEHSNPDFVEEELAAIASSIELPLKSTDPVGKRNITIPGAPNTWKPPGAPTDWAAPAKI